MKLQVWQHSKLTAKVGTLNLKAGMRHHWQTLKPSVAVLSTQQGMRVIDQEGWCWHRHSHLFLLLCSVPLFGSWCDSMQLAIPDTTSAALYCWHNAVKG